MSKTKQVIAIGSKNPVKLEAVRLAITKVYPNQKFEFVGVNVPSTVSDQPRNDLETIAGAEQRAKAALELVEDAVMGVGLEAGLTQVGEDWYVTGWVAITNRDGVIGRSSSGRAPML